LGEKTLTFTTSASHLSFFKLSLCLAGNSQNEKTKGANLFFIQEPKLFGLSISLSLSAATLPQTFFLSYTHKLISQIKDLIRVSLEEE
jgi:hypothetical protein